MIKTTRVISALLFCALSQLANAQTYTNLYWGIDRTATPNEISVKSADGSQWFNLFKLTAAGEPTPYFSSTFCASNEWITASGGVPACSQPAITNLAAIATNTVVANPTNASAIPQALAVASCDTASKALQWTTNTGFACNSSITAAAVPVGGITGLGTGVATALAVNVGSAGAFVTFNGALGTPSSGTLTNATGLPVSTGISGLGTGVASALAAATASAANVQAGTSTTNLVTPSALSGSAAAQTLTDGATINWDVASGYNAKLTLTASGHTVAAPTNVIEGVTYTLQLDVGSGPYTLNWNAVFNWGAAGTPTVSTGANDIHVISCIARATNNLLCNINKGF